MQRHGYFLASTYTYGVYPETFPNHLAFLSLMSGHRPPDPERCTVIEFGCGQGVNLCLQAALHPESRFFGIDLSADHVAHASELASAAGLDNIHFVQADLLELASGSALPQPLEEAWGQAQIAVAHGVLGWVNPTVGEALRLAAAAALAPGGLLYLSYNVLPGWLPELPFQHAVLALERRSGSAGQGVRLARGLFEHLGAAEAQVFRGVPSLASRLGEMGNKSQAYLLHEYTHTHWQPLYADQVIEACAAEGLAYLGSADLPDSFQGLLPEAYQQLIAQQPDPAMQQLVRDLLVNKEFRRDLYAHGRVPLWANEAEQRLEAIRLRCGPGARLPGPQENFAVRCGAGEIRLPADIWRPLVQRLQQGPATLGELQALTDPPTPLAEVLPRLCLLLHGGAIEREAPARDPAPAQRLNALLLSRVDAGAPYQWLAIPGVGGAAQFDRLALLTLHAVVRGHSRSDVGRRVAERMARFGITFSDTGEDTEAQRQALEKTLDQFYAKQLPLLQGLGVIHVA